MKKLSILPIALVLAVGAVWATSVFPDTTEFPANPSSPGTLGYVLGLFGISGTAPDSTALAGRSATGYLQGNNCTAPGEVWRGVDTSGKAVCGLRSNPLAFAKILEGTMQVNGTSKSAPTILYEGDRIDTNVSQTGTIQFTDDISIARLSTSTSIILERGNTDGTIAQVVLDQGLLWGRVLTSTGINIGGGGLIAGVRGTSVSLEKTGTQYKLSIIDSRSPANAVGLMLTSATRQLGSTIPYIYSAENQFIYNSGAPSLPSPNLITKANLLTESPWIRENMKQDILYLTGSTEYARQMEYVAAEPENNEKNRLCIDYSGTFDGKWMTDAYGCQPMSMLAMADYTKTGVLTVAYTDSMKKAQVKNTCPYAGVLCYDTIHQTCNIGEHLVGVRGNCMYPETAYHNPNEWSRYDLDINGNIQEAWQYDCKTLDSIESTNYTQYQHYETSSGGAILDIYCAENSVSSILFPLAMTAGSMQPDAALGGVNITATNARIEYTFINPADLALLAGKTITIQISAPLSNSINTTGGKGYLFDGGTIKYFYVNKGKCNPASSTEVIDNKICKQIGTQSTVDSLYTNATNLYLNILDLNNAPISPNKFVLGAFNSTGTNFVGQIKNTLKKMIIQ